MRITSLILTFSFVANLLFGQTDERIISIRKSVQSINNETGYKIKTLTNDYFADEKNEDADNGQELKGYYKGGKLKKIIYSAGLSNCMKTYEYYLADAGLIFVFEKEDDYPYKKDGSGLDYSKLVPAFEGRYYFDKGNIFQTKTKGQEKSAYPDKNRFSIILKDFLKDLKHAKSK
jgi:hypothetical protein